MRVTKVHVAKPISIVPSNAINAVLVFLLIGVLQITPVIQNTDLKNQIGYIARIQENQSHLLLNIETNKGNTIVTNDKLKTMEQKIKQMEQDFKNFLIMRSTLVEDK